MAKLRQALTEEDIKKLRVNEVKTKYNELAKDYNRIINGDLVFCHNCNEFHNHESFYADKRYYSGYYPECRKSLLNQACDYDKKTDTYTDNREKTIEVFRKLDLPFIESIYNKALTTTQMEMGEKNRRTGYQHTLVIVKSLQQYNSKHFSDSEFEITEEVIEFQSDKKSRDEIKKIFGSGFTETDYLYLQDQYDDWKARTQVDSKSQETYIVQICFKQLEIWKAQKEGKDTDKLVKSLNDLMNAANLQPKQNVTNAANDTLTFSQLLEKWEEHDPVTTASDEFKDVDGIMKYLKIWFGWITKAVGIKNAYTKEYEDEIAKYTVTKTERTDDDSEDIYSAIFGKEE